MDVSGNASTPSPGGRHVLPASIWALGFGSMLMDISSELIHSLLPIFMVTVLGTSMVTVGLIEGVAEATAAISKVFSGALSDYLGRRKRLLVLGYALAALTKPVFPLATSIGWVFAARFVDRIGKGIRGAPRDALVADLVPNRLRGAAYGLRQALDALGAVIGPLLALLLMLLLANDIAAAMWAAVVPAFLCVVLLLRYVREPERPAAGDGGVRPPLRLADIRQLRADYWWVVIIGAVFTLARFSEAFLILRVEDVGVPLGYVPLALVVMNLFYAGCAYPAGRAADRLDARRLLMLSLLLLVLGDLLLAAGGALPAFAGIALWGLHMAFSQGLLAKLVADSAPPALRGTAFGFFNLLSGVALLAASVIAGVLWSRYGPDVTFLVGAAFAALAALGLLAWRSPREV